MNHKFPVPWRREFETETPLRVVFGLPLRQTEGFLDSLLSLMSRDLKAPDHTPLSRRNPIVVVPPLTRAHDGPIDLIVERQRGPDREVRVSTLPSAETVLRWYPRGNRILAQPDRDVSAAPEATLVLPPVPDSVLRFVLAVDSARLPCGHDVAPLISRMDRNPPPMLACPLTPIHAPMPISRLTQRDDNLLGRKSLSCHPCLLPKIEIPNTSPGLVLGGKVNCDLPPRVAPPSKLDSGPFEVHSRG